MCIMPATTRASTMKGSKTKDTAMIISNKLQYDGDKLLTNGEIKPSKKENGFVDKREDFDEDKPAPWQFFLAYSVLFSAISCLATCIVYWLTRDNLTSTSSDGTSISELFRIPTVGDAKKIGSLILSYKKDYYYSVFGAYFASYILLQSLCIPGSLVLSILAGYLFPAPLALLIICTCSTLGASTFYIMIYKWKKPLIKFLNRRSNVERFNNFVQSKLKEYKSNLFVCVFILRATPIFPNWSINLCSPLINLPLRPFVLGTFTGVAPLSVLHVWTGSILNDLSNDQSLVSWQSIALTSLAAISVVLLFYIKRLAT